MVDREGFEPPVFAQRERIYSPSQHHRLCRLSIMVPSVRFERTLDSLSNHYLCQLGYEGEIGASGEIRTHTARLLRPMTPASWSTDAWWAFRDSNPDRRGF